MKIAIVGSGISGLVCAHYLSAEHAVTVFEAGSHVGGHTHTHDVEIAGQQYAVDTGFIVYNTRTYPNFIRLLEELGVASQPTTMSFSVSDPRNGFEYASAGLGVLARRRNLITPNFYRMLRDKFRFDRLAKQLLQDNPHALSQQTLGAFLRQHGFSASFARWYILPMAAAVWSAPLGKITDYPMLTLLTFLNNHGLLGLNDAPTWRVIKGGSRQYVRRLLEQLNARVLLNNPVTGIKRDADGVQISAAEGGGHFDRVIMACHSDQALALLQDASPAEHAVLGDIAYEQNETVLHTDSSLLPRRRRAWAAWNYQLPDGPEPKATLTYNMNRLQGLEAPETFCVTLNQTNRIDPAKILQRMHYAHPVYNHQTVNAQTRWQEIASHQRHTFYCGAYWFNGFHEDGVRSALRVCAAFGQRVEHANAA